MHVRVRRTGSKRWSLVGGRAVGILWLSGLPDETRFSELAVAAAQEREESEQMEQEDDHRARIFSRSEPTDQPLGRRTEFWRRTARTPYDTRAASGVGDALGSAKSCWCSVGGTGLTGTIAAEGANDSDW